MKTLPSGARVLSVLLLLPCMGASAQEKRPEVLRHRLFDRMGEAQWTGVPTGDAQGKTSALHWDFLESAPDAIFYGREQGRRLDWATEFGTLESEGGLSGRRLRLGPGFPEDHSRAVVAVAIVVHLAHRSLLRIVRGRTLARAGGRRRGAIVAARRAGAR